MMNRQLVSLRESIEAVDRRESLIETAVGAFATSLGDVDQHLFARWKDRSGERVGLIRDVVKALRTSATIQGLQQAQQVLATEAKDCGEWMETALAGSVDLRDVLNALNETSTLIRDGGQKNETRARGLADSLTGITQLNDVNLLKAGIRSQVGRLGEWIADLQKQNQEIAARFEKEVSHYEDRLRAAESLASTDPLTGLGNRRELESRVADLVAAETPFCVILFDLNRFKFINDRFGHLIGDEVLKSFSGRIKNQLRKTDFAARWGGDEFVVLLGGCGLRDAMARTQQLQMTVCGRYTLGREDKPVRLDVTASIGVAERRANESLEDLIGRADRQLYQQKGPAS